MASLKWSFFAGAAIIAAYLLLVNSVPLAAVVAGIALAAIWNWYHRRKA